MIFCLDTCFPARTSLSKPVFSFVHDSDDIARGHLPLTLQFEPKSAFLFLDVNEANFFENRQHLAIAFCRDKNRLELLTRESATQVSEKPSKPRILYLLLRNPTGEDEVGKHGDIIDQLNGRKADDAIFSKPITAA